jgi:hypothetical protein
MRALPFYDDEQNGGFMMLEGILRVEKGKLHFEFHKKDALIEVVKSGVKTAEIDLKDIDLIEYKKKLFGARLIIYAKRATVFEEFPGNDLTSRTLKVKRKHRDIAANIASNVNLYLSEQKLKELDGETE